MCLLLSLMAVSILITPANSMTLSGNFSTIEVNGQAEVAILPDNYAITVFIKERGKFADKIRTLVEHKTNQVIQVATNLDISLPDIHSSQISVAIIEAKPSIVVSGVETGHKFRKSSFSNKQHNKVYVEGNALTNQNITKPQYLELSRVIEIIFPTSKNYDQFLNKIVKLGFDGIYPQIISDKTIDEYYQQALSKALLNARDKAIKIASYSKVTLGKLISVKETTQMQRKQNYNLDKQFIHAGVLVKYSIEEQVIQ